MTGDAGSGAGRGDAAQGQAAPNSVTLTDDMLTPDILVLQARRSIATRRALTGRLPAAFLPDPALDILAALYVAHSEGRGVSRGSLSEQTAVLPNVAARWLSALTVEGLIIERAGEARLSTRGLNLVEDGLRAVIRACADIT